MLRTEYLQIGCDMRDRGDTGTVASSTRVFAIGAALGVSGMLAGGASVAQAQTSTAGTSGALSQTATADDNGAQLEEITVTAQKREERLKDVPISISVLGSESLDDNAVQGIAEALNAIPGVATSNFHLGGGTLIEIRGVNAAVPEYTGASPVAYYLDTVPFGLVKSAIAPDSSAYDMQRVEVLRGPQGTLYGASALNGVVRVLTQDADLGELELKARVADSGTSHGGNNYRGDVAVNVPLIADKLAVRAVAGYESLSGWIDQPNKDDANDTQRRTFRIKLNAQPSEDLSVALSAWRSRSDSGAPSVGYTFDETSSVLDQPISTEYNAYGLKAAYRIGGITLSSMTSYLDYVDSGVVGLDIPLFGAPDSIFASRIRSNIFSEELIASSSRERSWYWSLGAMYRRATEDSFRYYTGLFAAVPTLDNSNLSKSTAVFGELTHTFFDRKLEVTAGLRSFSDDESQHDSIGGGPFVPGKTTSHANTPRVVLTWHPDDERMLYASYAQGFRSGFSQSGDVLFEHPDFPSVHPDRLRNYEIGSKGTLLMGRLAYDAAVYYMDWQDIQQLLVVPFQGSPGVLAIVNAESASGPGVDFAFTAQVLRGLTLNANVSWNDLKMDNDTISGGVVLFAKGTRPSGSAGTTAGAGVDYSFGLGARGLKGRLSASATYKSKLIYQGLGGVGVRSVGDSMVSSRLSVSVDSPASWSTTLFVDNLNNERGRAAQPFIGAADWIARVRPRTIGIQAEYRFAGK